MARSGHGNVLVLGAAHSECYVDTVVGQGAELGQGWWLMAACPELTREPMTIQPWTMSRNLPTVVARRAVVHPEIWPLPPVLPLSLVPLSSLFPVASPSRCHPSRLPSSLLWVTVTDTWPVCLPVCTFVLVSSLCRLCLPEKEVKEHDAQGNFNGVLYSTHLPLCPNPCNPTLPTFKSK